MDASGLAARSTARCSRENRTRRRPTESQQRRLRRRPRTAPRTPRPLSRGVRPHLRGSALHSVEVGRRSGAPATPAPTDTGPTAETGTFSGGSIVASNVIASTAIFRFTGTAVSWIGEVQRLFPLNGIKACWSMAISEHTREMSMPPSSSLPFDGPLDLRRAQAAATSKKLPHSRPGQISFRRWRSGRAIPHPRLFLFSVTACVHDSHPIGPVYPLSGSLFAFVNRRGHYVKALYWDRRDRVLCFSTWLARSTRGPRYMRPGVIGRQHFRKCGETGASQATQFLRRSTLRCSSHDGREPHVQETFSAASPCARPVHVFCNLGVGRRCFCDSARRCELRQSAASLRGQPGPDARRRQVSLTRCGLQPGSDGHGGRARSGAAGVSC